MKVALFVTFMWQAEISQKFGTQEFQIDLTWLHHVWFPSCIHGGVIGVKGYGLLPCQGDHSSCLWTEASGGVRLKTSSYSALDPQKHYKRIWVQTNLVRCLHGFRSLSTHVSHLFLRLCWGVVWGSFNFSPFVFGASFSFSSGSATFSASSWHGARITRCTVQL